MAKNNLSHEPTTIANATAATIAFVYVVCALSISLFPEAAMTVARSWFHGIRLEEISGWNVSMGSLILGFVSATAGGWILGFVFAKFQNYFAK